jgi:hypothetical protein
MAYLQVSPLGGSRNETWRGQRIREISVSWNLQRRFPTKYHPEPPTDRTIRTLLKCSGSTGALYLYTIYSIYYTLSGFTFYLLDRIVVTLLMLWIWNTVCEWAALNTLSVTLLVSLFCCSSWGDMVWVLVLTERGWFCCFHWQSYSIVLLSVMHVKDSYVHRRKRVLSSAIYCCVVSWKGTNLKSYACCIFQAGFLLGLFSELEDGVI